MADWQVAQQNLLDDLKNEEDRKMKKTLRNRNRRQKAKKLEISEIPEFQVPVQAPKVITNGPGNLKSRPPAEPCLADLLQSAEIDVIVLRDLLAAKNLEISSAQQQLKLARDKLSEVNNLNDQLGERLANNAPLTKEEGQKQVELLRREITQVDHQRLRLKAQHEASCLANLEFLKEEISIIEMKRNQVAAKMAAQRKLTADERRNFQVAQTRVDREREKLTALLKSIGVSNSSRLLNAEEISDISADRDRKIAEEKKAVIAMCNEELEKVNKRIEIVTREVPKILVNGGSRGNACTLTIQLARKVLQRATK